VFPDQEFLDAFEFITEGVANMFISGQKVGEDTDILYKVLKTIRQLNDALSNNPDRPDVLQARRSPGTYNSKPVLPSVLREEFPQSPNIPTAKSFMAVNARTLNT
jgi:hypothetical protein